MAVYHAYHYHDIDMHQIIRGSIDLMLFWATIAMIIFNLYLYGYGINNLGW